MAKREPQLDGVRGIAVLMVVIAHYVYGQIALAPQTPLAYLLRPLSLCATGVDLFFVLSGYLIVGILLDHKGASNYFRVFYARRVFRILPIYFLILGVYVLLRGVQPDTWLFAHPLPLLGYFTFTQNFFMAQAGHFGPHWLGVTWSLAVEEQFYLVIPALVYFLPRKGVITLFILLILIAPLSHYLLPEFTVYVSALSRADALLSGALVAVAMRTSRERLQLLPLGMFCLVMAAMAALLFFLHSPLFTSALAITYALFVLFIVTYRAPRRLQAILTCRVLVWLGTISYGLYLYHEIVSGLLHQLIRHAPPQLADIQGGIVTILALALSLLCAEVSFRYLETPLLRIGQRFTYQAN